jgi:peptide/nickel transport system permease protein
LFGITVLIFGAMRILPGHPLARVGGEGQGQYQSSDEELRAARASLGLDRSLPEQYLSWMADVARGDLGHSF